MPQTQHIEENRTPLQVVPHDGPRIDRMGIEIEGGFLVQEYKRLQPSGIFRGDGSVRDVGKIVVRKVNGYTQVQHVNLYHPGEVASPALEPKKLLTWVRWHFPARQNESCGTHVHVSVRHKADYDRLATREFYTEFLNRSMMFMELHKPDLPKGVWDAFKRRFDGDNSYCCKNFNSSCEHVGGSRSSARNYPTYCTHICNEDCYVEDEDNCDHDCWNHMGVYEDNPCLTSNCDHSCTDNHQYELADEGHRHACQVHSCEHDDVACAEECGEDGCDHSCGLDCYLENRNGCQHECDGDCYHTGHCVHEHDNDCSRRNNCIHNHVAACYPAPSDNDPDGDDLAPIRIAHTPEQQRAARGKDLHRYAHLNFCERLHGTMEIRLFPAMKSWRLTQKVVQFCEDTIEQYLAEPEIRRTPERHEKWRTLSIGIGIDETSSYAEAGTDSVRVFTTITDYRMYMTNRSRRYQDNTDRRTRDWDYWWHDQSLMYARELQNAARIARIAAENERALMAMTTSSTQVELSGNTTRRNSSALDEFRSRCRHDYCMPRPDNTLDTYRWSNIRDYESIQTRELGNLSDSSSSRAYTMFHANGYAERFVKALDESMEEFRLRMCQALHLPTSDRDQWERKVARAINACGNVVLYLNEYNGNARRFAKRNNETQEQFRQRVADEIGLPPGTLERFTDRPGPFTAVFPELDPLPDTAAEVVTAQTPYTYTTSTL